MSRPMPTDNTFLQGNGAPLNFEGESGDLVVLGEIPNELSGTYFRNGSNPQFAPRRGYHFFDGDGMIHSICIRSGRASYKNRWVRTERFLLERQAGEALFGSMVDPGSSHPSVVGKSSNAANTNVVWHGGKLLALWEGGLPTEIDPVTLETRGIWDFEGQLTRRIDPTIAAQLGLTVEEGRGQGVMTAHPKIDPKTGEMLIFGAAGAPPYLLYHVISADGKLVRTEEIDVPFPAMMHDFIVTDQHVIFPVFPATFDFEAMAEGTSLLAWKPELGTHLGVMPREGSAGDVIWIESDPCYVFHPANAYSQGDRIVAEVVRFPELPLFGGTGAGSPAFWRWTLDLGAGRLQEEQLDELPTEFPRIDERFAGLPYRYSWGPCLQPSTGTDDAALGFNAIVRYDVSGGERKIHEPGAGAVVGEPIFVPRSSDAPEGDGFLLCLAYRSAEKRSDLLILDAQQIESEPLAVIQLPVRVPSGFHGNWKPDA